MAVKDQDIYHPTEALILANPRRHYRATISTVHWQLRCLISAEGRNTVYYPSGAGNLQIQRLDTETRETETINILPFLPRCLVAKNGWICSGGETGEFTAIDLNEGRYAPDIATDDAALEQALESHPDASQLLEHSGDLVGALRVRQSIRTLAQAHKNLVSKSKQFGKERVNCITLWFPPTTLEPYRGAYDEPVAVLANNDKSVAIVRLRSQELVVEIEYPDCVNRAVCSPDGRLLIAVSDDPYLYVHEQTCTNPHSKDTLGSAYRPVYRWALRNKIHLISQSQEDRSDNRGSFAACFSSSGRYLAVGTQYGAISIFDTAALTDPDTVSLVTSFTSSRPNNTLGAVRAMEFAPGPIDLLAWTEDRGRVGVADMRNGCTSRQILYLDKDDGYDHLSLSDRGAIDPRLLDTNRRSDSTAEDATASVMSPSMAEMSRRLASPGVSDADLDRMNQPLTAEETRVLEALQEHSRRRVLQRAADRVSATPTPTQRLLSSGARAERTAAVSAAVNDVLGSIRDIRDQRDRLRENMERQERIRNYAREEALEADDLLFQRRRPGSSGNAAGGGGGGGRRAVPAPPAPVAPQVAAMPTVATTTTTTAPAPTTRAGASGSEDALSARRALASRLMGDLPSSTTTPAAATTTTNAWSDLEALWNLSFDTGGTATAAATLANPYESLRSFVDADARRRDRAAFLIREWETNPARRMGMAGMGLGLRRSVADPFDTAGLAWSEDGRKLFVGAEEGIYEFQVNMLNRKFMPTSEPR